MIIFGKRIKGCFVNSIINDHHKLFFNHNTYYENNIIINMHHVGHHKFLVKVNKKSILNKYYGNFIIIKFDMKKCNSIYLSCRLSF